jgi:hypothetical protein
VTEYFTKRQKLPKKIAQRNFVEVSQGIFDANVKHEQEQEVYSERGQEHKVDQERNINVVSENNISDPKARDKKPCMLTLKTEVAILLILQILNPFRHANI